MELNSFSLAGCAPTQIVNLNMAFNNLDNIKIFNECKDTYDLNSLMFSYSIDSLCWSCYMNYCDFLTNTVDLKTDFYVRIKLQGQVSQITLDDEPFYDYSTQLDSNFIFSYCDNTTSSNIYNPYANMDGAIQLYQNLSNSVTCIAGIPIYYFKLSPNVGSKDITFKEYALIDVESVKQIKLMVSDGMMPSSKPEFSDFGLEWQTDWTTEITKSMFATAFGPTAQPMEGDLIYIPMMKRMWMVNEAYEEKRDGFMWVATTFKVSLVKYQEKGSVDLGNAEDLVNTFVKNKYEDLFGDDNEDNRGSGEEFTDAPISAKDNLFPIFESDSQRKYVSCEGIDIKDESTYYKGTVISDKCYYFQNMIKEKTIIYQRKYCGIDGTISFIIRPFTIKSYKDILFSIGTTQINISQSKWESTISLNKSKKCTLKLDANTTYFVMLRWSKDLNIIEMSAAKYVWPEEIPLYKLQSGNYYYDIDNMNTVTDKWNVEMEISAKSSVILKGFYGTITNIKLFDYYNDNISEIMQMYPTNNRLLINDTARNIIGLEGYKLR